MEETLFGRSQFDQTENHGVGTVNVGVTAIYKQTWTAGLVYNDYIGSASRGLQATADRGYLSLNIEHTF